MILITDYTYFMTQCTYFNTLAYSFAKRELIDLFFLFGVLCKNGNHGKINTFFKYCCFVGFFFI